MDHNERRAAFARTAFCQGLSAEVLDEIADVAVPQQYQADVAVMETGDDADGLYLVVSGTARVENAFAGTSKVVGTLKAPDVFGEVALLGGDKRTSTVLANEALTCLLLPTEPMQALMQRHPEVREHLEQLGHRRATTNLELHLGELPEIPD